MVHLNHENTNPTIYDFLIDCLPVLFETMNSRTHGFYRNHENGCHRIRVLSQYIMIYLLLTDFVVCVDLVFLISEFLHLLSVGDGESIIGGGT